MRNFKKQCTASDLAAVDAPGVIMGIREAIASFRENFIISAWAILLFVQQYRAILTASECGSDNGRFTLFLLSVGESFSWMPFLSYF